MWGLAVATGPASRQMADKTSKQKWTTDFLHSESEVGEEGGVGAGEEGEGEERVRRGRG